MLAIERKKTDKVDFVKPLEQYIRNQYSAQVAQDHQEAINYLQQLREDVRNSTDKNDVVKDLMFRYYGLVLSLETRFPITENHVCFVLQHILYQQLKLFVESDTYAQHLERRTLCYTGYSLHTN
jgi:hypothetical protein